MARRVSLMLTCLCDGLYGGVGVAAVKCLEACGCEVVFDERQTCCGQPPFNSGDWPSARKIADHCKSVLFADGAEVVTPSGSCAAMIREGYHLLYPEDAPPMCWELGEFLVKGLGITSWPAAGTYEKKVAYHRSCHGRGIGLTTEHETLLRSVPGIQLVEFQNPEQCCGFGGSFSALQPTLSQAIGLEKLRTIVESGAEEIVASDMGCLMHLDGLIKRNDLPVKVRHFAEVLASALLGGSQ